MKMTAKGRYAVAAMLDLALHQDRGAVSLSAIAQRQHIPSAYLEQLFARLRRRGLVISLRGPGGGYRLAANSSEISVAQVLRAVSELSAARRQLAVQQDHYHCFLDQIWHELDREVEQYLSGVSLAEVLQRRAETKPRELAVAGPRRLSR
jgi:Rrf2 family iron-sulfur cluster assembly transcriptional regulator